MCTNELPNNLELFFFRVMYTWVAVILYLHRGYKLVTNILISK